MQSFSCENPFNPPSCSRLVSGRINAVPLCLFLCITMPSASAKCKRVNTHTLFGVLVDNTRGYFTSCVASNEYNVRPYYLPKHGIRGYYSTAFWFRFALLQQKNGPIKPGLYSATGRHILRVLLPLYGKMTQQWNSDLIEIMKKLSWILGNCLFQECLRCSSQRPD